MCSIRALVSRILSSIWGFLRVFSQNLGFLTKFIYVSFYLVNIYLHADILTPRSSKLVKNSSFYNFFKKWALNFWDFWRETYPLGSPWEGVRGLIQENLFAYHESTWSVGLKNAITLKSIFQNSGVDCTPFNSTYVKSCLNQTGFSRFISYC